MRLMKVFDTSIIPEEFFETLWEGEVIVKDGYGPYAVGYFVEESLKEGALNKETPVFERLDKWLIEGGAFDGEEVLIYHG